MFVPLPEIQKHTPLKSVEDCIKVLENYVIKKYPTMTTDNVRYTKTECMGVLYSFYMAGKLSMRLTPLDVDSAVQKCMDEKLWVTVEEYNSASIELRHSPYSWFIGYPILQQFEDMFRYHVTVVATTYYTYKAFIKVFYMMILRKFRMMRQRNKKLD